MIITVIIGGTKGLGKKMSSMFSDRGDIVYSLGRNSELPDIIPNYLIFSQRYRGVDDDWDGEISTSLTKTKNVIQHYSYKMKTVKDNTSILIIGSVASTKICKSQPMSYHVAKSGLLQIVRYTASVLGIRCNMLSPNGFRNKPITTVGEINSEIHISNIAKFLCSDESIMINGQEIVADGGDGLFYNETA